MLFQRPPTTAEEIRAFCQRFHEGIRVEYKSTFDANVRRNTAKMVSAFANTLGGVIVIGVNAQNGVPEEPIEGFDDPGEELTLVVEQICLQGMNPPVMPRITPVASDIAGKCFLVVEVDESPEAPHAIENQTRVYVRTGNAANPYELASVDVIIERFTRRSELQRFRRELVNFQTLRAKELLAIDPAEMAVEISAGPLYPRRPLVDRESVWDFANEQRYRGGRFIPLDVIRRTNDGIAGVNEPSREFGDLTRFGFVFWKKVAQSQELAAGNRETLYWRFADVFQSILKALVCASRAWTAFSYRGQVQIDVRLGDCFRKTMPFVPDALQQMNLDDFRSIERSVSAQLVIASEVTAQNRDAMVLDILHQVCWSFWQPIEPYPRDWVRQYIERIMRDTGPI